MIVIIGGFPPFPGLVAYPDTQLHALSCQTSLFFSLILNIRTMLSHLLTTILSDADLQLQKAYLTPHSICLSLDGLLEP